jgi:hypothetical protein
MSAIFIHGGRAVRGARLQLLYHCDRGFESHFGHGCSSLVFVVCCEGSGLCDELLTHSEESYQMCLIVCDLETSIVRQPRPKLGCHAMEKNTDMDSNNHKGYNLDQQCLMRQSIVISIIWT